MPNNYPGLPPNEAITIPADINLSQIIVQDVLQQLEHFSAQPNCMKAHINDRQLKVAYDTNYTDATHFQGIVRLIDSNVMIISGGDKNNRLGCLFIFEIDSVFDKRIDRSLYLGSNCTHRLLPVSRKDTLIEIVSLSTGDFWHVGGISSMGHLLLAPIEDAHNNISRIKFYNVANATRPIAYDHITIERDTKFGKIGCAAMCRLPNQYFILAAWRDESKKGQFDIYYSKTSDLNDGFHQTRDEVICVDFEKLGYKSNLDPQYQSIQFVIQDDGKIFLIGFFGYGTYPVIKNSGNNMIDVYQVLLPEEDLSSNPSFEQITIEHIKSLHIANASLFYNFEAAACLYEIKGQLVIYSPFYWARNHELKLAEFCPSFHHKETFDYPETIIELYEDKNFKGRCLRLYGDQDEIEMDNTSAQGEDFTDQISSVVYLLEETDALRLSDDKGQERSFHGKGKVIGKLPDLGKMNDKVSKVGNNSE